MEPNDNWDILTKKISGEISPEENRLLEEWLLEEDNLQLYETISRVGLEQTNEQAIRAKDNVFKHTFNKIFSIQERKQNKFRKNSFFLSVAASLALIISIGSVFLLYQNYHNTPIEPSIVVLTCPSGLSTIVLPDSSVVTLNAGSILKYPAYFEKDSRRVDLTGEAYFDVKHDKTKPFIVATKEMDIQVLGTTFNVSAYPQDEEVITSLLTGSVELTDHLNRQQWTLIPNQTMIYNKTSSEVQLKSIEPEYITGWMSGDLFFKKLPFNLICNMLERKFGCEIEIENTKMQEKIFTGRFVNNESLTQILAIIKINVPFSYTMKDNKVIIY